MERDESRWNPYPTLLANGSGRARYVWMAEMGVRLSVENRPLVD